MVLLTMFLGMLLLTVKKISEMPNTNSTTEFKESQLFLLSTNNPSINLVLHITGLQYMTRFD